MDQVISESGDAAPELPSTFTDAEGREWEPRLDYVKLRKILAVARVDLGNVQEMAKTWAELIYDDLKLLETVWLSIADDDGAAAAGVTKDEWLATMDGDLLDDARLALRFAIDSFTRPLKRKILRQGMDAIEAGYRRAIAEAENRIERELPEMIEQSLSKARGTPAPKSPASSATSTTAGRSGKHKSR